MIGIKVVTLITAFGIALVKAYLVAKNFMHINVEKRFVPYIVATVLVFMVLFFAGVAPDVMKKQGTQWEKPSWLVAPAQSRRRGPMRAPTTRRGPPACHPPEPAFASPPNPRAAPSSRTACSACCSSSAPRRCSSPA